jgi:Fic family protein
VQKRQNQRGEITSLQAKNREKVSAMGRAAKNALLVFEYLAFNPIIDIGKTAESLDVSYNTVSAAVKRFIDADILVQTENGKQEPHLCLQRLFGHST